MAEIVSSDIVISSLGISLSLFMVSLGAENTTGDEFGAALGISSKLLMPFRIQAILSYLTVSSNLWRYYPVAVIADSILWQQVRKATDHIARKIDFVHFLWISNNLDKNWLQNYEEFPLRVANVLFVSPHLRIQPEFSEALETTLQLTAETVNFTNANDANEIISGWCKTHTNERITNVLSSGKIIYPFPLEKL